MPSSKIRLGAGIVAMAAWLGVAGPRVVSVDSLASFMAGVEALRTAPGLTLEQKATKYRELEQICGVKGTDAVAQLESYRDDPEKWKGVCDKIQAIIVKADSVRTQQ